jgi:4-carboxymuconolactone decarboxylase
MHPILLEISTYASHPSHRERLLAALREAKNAGDVRREEVYECILQTYLFAGFPAALEGMRALRAVWPKVGDDEQRPPVSYPDFLERGTRLFEQVYGDKAERVKQEIRDLSPELGAWTMTDGYSKTLSRPGLAAATRELCTVAALTHLGWERQLLSHILGAANLGASAEDIALAIKIGAMEDPEKEMRAMKLYRK